MTYQTPAAPRTQARSSDLTAHRDGRGSLAPIPEMPHACRRQAARRDPGSPGQRSLPTGLRALQGHMLPAGDFLHYRRRKPGFTIRAGPPRTANWAPVRTAMRGRVT